MEQEQMKKRISLLNGIYNMSTKSKTEEDGLTYVFSLGKVYIFNNQKFDDYLGLPYRYGSDKDVEELKKTFKKLNFPEPQIYHDLKRIPFQMEIEKIAIDEDNELEKCRSLVCVFLSHGVDGHIYLNDGKVEVDYIYEKLCNIENLRYKPKIFIFQYIIFEYAVPKTVYQAATPVDSCNEMTFWLAKASYVGRGSQCNVTGALNATGCKSEGTASASFDVVNLDETDASAEIPFDSDGFSGRTHRGADCLTVYATTKGYVSFRNPLYGSWFIQKLCEVLQDYAAGKYDKYRPDIMKLLTLVSAEVSERSVYIQRQNQAARIVKQMPSFVSSLRKQLFLRDHDYVAV